MKLGGAAVLPVVDLGPAGEPHSPLAGAEQRLADEGVIGWTIRESFFQRRRGLATLTATTAAGRQYYEGVDMDVAAAVRLADEVHPGLLTPFLVERES